LTFPSRCPRRAGQERRLRVAERNERAALVDSQAPLAAQNTFRVATPIEMKDAKPRFMALLLKGLVLAEIGNSRPERIDGQHLVANLLAKRVDDIGGPELALLLGVIKRAGEDLEELDPSPKRRLPQVFDGDVLDLHIDVRLAWVEQEGIDDLFLL